MEFIIDSINLEEIKDLFEYLPMSGVTSNPSIVAKEFKDKDSNNNYQDFYKHMQAIEKIIGDDDSLHIQVIATKAEDIVQEAYFIKEQISSLAYVKIPVTKEGLKAIKLLKTADKNFRITATAVYDIFQAYYAIALEVDYLAPYVNRIENLNNDPYKLISDTIKMCQTYNYKTKILAASFKNANQIIKALNAGSHAITAPYDLLLQVFENPSIELAVANFNKDWNTVFKKGIGIIDEK